MDDLIRANRILGSRKPLRKLKSNDEVRVCEEEECITKLSRYNITLSRCYSHAPKQKPRIRGRKT